MNRRARALTLIALLAGGTTARAALVRPALRARVAVRCVESGRLEGLCAWMRKNGLAVRLVRVGRSAWVEISAGLRGDLGAVLKAFRRAAEAQGMRVRFRPGANETPEAIAARTAQLEQVQNVPAQTAPAALAAPPARPSPGPASLSQVVGPPKLFSIVKSRALAVRGPPA